MMKLFHLLLLTMCLAAFSENSASSENEIVLEVKDNNKFIQSKQSKKEWINERKGKIVEVLSGKKFRIPEGYPSDTPFCHSLMKDIKTLDGMRIIAPEIVSDSLKSPEVSKVLYKDCPNIYSTRRSSGIKKEPRKIILYHQDIDNDATNGVEWVLGDHYIQHIMPRWGDEFLVQNVYLYFDVKSCKHLSGSVRVGASQRYGIKTKLSDIRLVTGLHGLVNYKKHVYI